MAGSVKDAGGGGGVAAGTTGSTGATGETGAGKGVADVTSRSGPSTSRAGSTDGIADGGFNTTGGVALGRGRGGGVTTTTRGGTVTEGVRVAGGVALTLGRGRVGVTSTERGGIVVEGVADFGSAPGDCVDGVVEGRRFLIALKIEFRSTFMDVPLDAPLGLLLGGAAVLGVFVGVRGSAVGVLGVRVAPVVAGVPAVADGTRVEGIATRGVIGAARVIGGCVVTPGAVDDARVWACARPPPASAITLIPKAHAERRISLSRREWFVPEGCAEKRR